MVTQRAQTSTQRAQTSKQGGTREPSEAPNGTPGLSSRVTIRIGDELQNHLGIEHIMFQGQRHAGPCWANPNLALGSIQGQCLPRTQHHLSGVLYWLRSFSWLIKRLRLKRPMSKVNLVRHNGIILATEI